MASLLSKLEKGEVPAEVANLRFASLLLDNPNVVYGDVQGHPHHFLVGLGVTSVKTGLGLDVSPAMAAHCKTAVQGMITWLRSASNDLKNGHANAATVLFTEMGELLDQGMCDRAERKLQFCSHLSRTRCCSAAMRCSSAMRTRSPGFWRPRTMQTGVPSWPREG